MPRGGQFLVRRWDGRKEEWSLGLVAGEHAGFGLDLARLAPTVQLCTCTGLWCAPYSSKEVITRAPALNKYRLWLSALLQSEAEETRDRGAGMIARLQIVRAVARCVMQGVLIC